MEKMKTWQAVAINIVGLTIIVLAINGLPRKRIEWFPDAASSRVIMVVRGGLFAEDKFLALEWKKTHDYEPNEMAWCAKIGNKWEKIFPFGEDLNRAQYREEWLKASP